MIMENQLHDLTYSYVYFSSVSVCSKMSACNISFTEVSAGKCDEKVYFAFYASL